MNTSLKTKVLLLVAVAVAAGFVSAKYLAQGNPAVTVPWGVIALLSAFIAKNRRESLMFGGYIGFAASYAYLWFDNTDKLTAGKATSLIFLIILPALFGLLCGLLCAWLGWLCRTHLFKSNN